MSNYKLRIIKSEIQNPKSKIGLLFLIIVLLFSASLSIAIQKDIYVLTIDGVINPASTEYILEGIDKAEEEKAEAVIIQLDTPGGLQKSMEIITKKILNADIPIIVYVSPSGSRAASAGTFITMAAHIAAMAPGTSIGAAHPVSMYGEKMGEEMAKKIENYTVSYIRSIAEERGRNAEWAKKAVLESVSITEKEAKENNVIDLIASDLEDLTNTLDGYKVKIGEKEYTLATKEAELIYYQMGLRQRILDALSDPNIAYILLMLGLLGIFFELSHPGVILPGVIGGIFTILGFYALHTLPVNYAGLLLIIFAIILFIAEIKVVSYGMLTVGGIVSMVLGSIMLINTPVSYLRISYKVIFTVVITITAFFLFLAGAVLKAHLKKPTTGNEGLVGEEGKALSKIDPDGQIFIHGEIWQATSEKVIGKGEKVKVVSVNNLLLKVEKAD